jgi:uncharacterized protein (TIGR03435 family)
MKFRHALILFLSGLTYGQKAERLTFEVSSIKPTPSDSRGGGIKPLPGGQTYEARGVPVKLIMSLMYKIPQNQISGGPGWLETDRWDIDAKAAHSSSIDDLHVMFQNLLADEFKLKFHKEIKEGPVYALVVDKGGSKMKVNQSPQDYDIPIKGGDRGVTIGTRVPMEYFSWWLSQGPLRRDGRPIIDRTGLTGVYDFQLSFAPDLPPGFDTSQLPPGLMDRPDIFTAVKAQLGLKLEAQKGPVNFYIIDSAEKPAAN